MSLPGACLQEITHRKATQLLLPAQFGIGVSSGPESIVLLGRALAALCPDEALCFFDVVNAFGQISRSEVLEEAMAELPELANCIECLG